MSSASKHPISPEMAGERLQIIQSKLVRLIAWLMCILMFIFALWIPSSPKATLYSDESTKLTVTASNSEVSGIVVLIKSIFIIVALVFAVTAMLMGSIISRNNKVQAVLRRLVEIEETLTD